MEEKKTILVALRSSRDHTRRNKIFVGINNHNPMPKAVRRGSCEWCNKALVPIGDRRRNGSRKCIDWDDRQYHLSCQKKMRRDEQADEPEPETSAALWEPRQTTIADVGFLGREFEAIVLEDTPHHNPLPTK
jgi:hypothetical protein